MVQFHEEGNLPPTQTRQSCCDMTKTSVNFKKTCSLQPIWLISLEASLKAKLKKGFFQLNHLRFSRKAKCLTVVAIAAVLLISVFAFLPKQSVSKGLVPQSNDNSTTSPTPSPAANGGNASEAPGIADWFGQIGQACNNKILLNHQLLSLLA